MKTVLTRRAAEWDNFLETIINAREEKGQFPKLKKPELERLILHNFTITELREDMINLKINEREEAWMRA